ncbi:MAG: FAD-dependent monooxygenase [Candidatus Eisenbacteria bacterium]|uniref:FAD-dependent monooxygenase n=1 Tax=Eiseniibacteriota bacterium TaxID=2212470 RepID=A0A956SDD3_UNCEI|nr:FAD-dependent monooxygenase [Candidatus Eisenbacteria bacterium]
MRILIVGAGVAGMTLAALLRRQGLDPTMVEKAPNLDHAGYMLGLWPLGYRVLHGLSLYDRFAAESIPGNHYEVRSDDGSLVHNWSMEPISRKFGPNLSCTRPQLVRLLREELGDLDLRYGTGVSSIEQGNSDVLVEFTDGSSGEFDLVVGADGIHSQVRALVFGEAPTYDTGWGGWVWWASLETLPKETFMEHWGAGRFVGAYPTHDGAGIFAGGPRGDGLEDPGPGRRDRIRAHFGGMGERVDAWLEALPDDDKSLFYWKLRDIRSEEWTKGRVVLLGDAAAAFLPTAGIGASMAMESAAVLADELSRTDQTTLPHALSLYVKRRRDRVERIQDDSRHLARAMFVKSGTLAHIRDLITKHYSLEQLAKSIAKAFDEPI